jgi:hypothetical protein
MSNWFKNAGDGEVRYVGSVYVDVSVQAHPDNQEEYKRALGALYSKLYEGDANAEDGSPAFVKMNFQDLQRR